MDFFYSRLEQDGKACNLTEPAGIFGEKITRKIFFLFLLTGVLSMLFVVYTIAQFYRVADLQEHDENYNKRRSLFEKVELHFTAMERDVLTGSKYSMNNFDELLEKATCISEILHNGGEYYELRTTGNSDSACCYYAVTFNQITDSQYSSEHDELKKRLIDVAAARTAGDYSRVLPLLEQGRKNIEIYIAGTNDDIRQTDALVASRLARAQTTMFVGLLCFAILASLLYWQTQKSILRILKENKSKSRRVKSYSDTLEQVLMNMPACIAITDQQRNFLYVNNVTAAILSVERDKLRGMSANTFLSEEAFREMSCALDNKAVLTDHNGEKRTVLINSMVLYMGNEKCFLHVFMNIERMERIEKEIKEQKAFTEAILDSVQVGILVMDRETGHVIHINKRGKELLAVDEETLLQGLGCHDISIHRDDIQCPYDDNDRVDNIEKRIMMRDGFSDVIINGTSVELNGRQIVIESIIDITERKKAQDNVQITMQQQKALLSAMPGMVFLKDRQLRYIAANRALAKSLGVPLSEISGKTDFDFYTEEEAEFIRIFDSHIMETGEAVMNFEEPVNLENGSKKWMMTNKIPYRNSSGEVIGIAASVTDVTSIKISQLHTKKRLEFIQLLIDNIPDPVMFTDWDGEFSGVNIAFRDFFSVSSMDELERYRTENPDMQDIEYLFNRERSFRTITSEITLRKWDGKIRTMTVNISSFGLEEGRGGTIVTLTDITDKKRFAEDLLNAKIRTEEANRELREAIVRAENLARAADEANRTKSLFLANMSHELRTPMHGILSYSRFGMKKYETAERTKLNHYFSQIYVSGERLMLLLNDLLDLSKLVSGRMEYTMECRQIMEVIDMVRSEYETTLKEKGLLFRIVQPDEKLLDIEYDVNRIGQVMRNVISNAIKFTPSGKEIKIAISYAEIQDGGIEIRVTDQGIGIPEDELDDVFDQFKQSARTRTGAGGTGLGLAISKEIVIHHGGRIWAEQNAAGQGTSVVIILPLRHSVTGERKAA